MMCKDGEPVEDSVPLDIVLSTALLLLASAAGLLRFGLRKPEVKVVRHD
jgi:hypothetical protein